MFEKRISIALWLQLNLRSLFVGCRSQKVHTRPFWFVAALNKKCVKPFPHSTEVDFFRKHQTPIKILTQRHVGSAWTQIVYCSLSDYEVRLEELKKNRFWGFLAFFLAIFFVILITK